MKSKTVSFIYLIIFLSSCIQHVDNQSNKDKKKLSYPAVNIEYAEGFSIVKQSDSSVLIQTKMPDTKELLSSFLLKENTQNKLNWPVQSFGIQSTTYFDYLNVLHETKRIVAVCNKNYFNPEQQAKLIDSVVEICTQNNFNLEKIAVLHPDIMLLYPFENKAIDKFNQIGIQTFLITEYLEKTPLARAEWLKFFGFLTDNSKMNEEFKRIKFDYLKLRKTEMTASMVFNVPFGDEWAMPSGTSIMANLMHDAGLSYPFENDTTQRNHVFSKEKAYDLLSKADYWVIIAQRSADFTLAKLKAENPIYATFPAVKNGKVIFCNTATSNYFSKGVLEPQIMLKDLLFCQGKLTSSENYKTHYFKLLN